MIVYSRNKVLQGVAGVVCLDNQGFADFKRCCIGVARCCSATPFTTPDFPVFTRATTPCNTFLIFFL